MSLFLSGASIIGPTVSLLASSISGLGRRRSPGSIGSEYPMLHVFLLSHTVPQDGNAPSSGKQRRFLSDGVGSLRGRGQGRRGTWNLRKR
jgi:hypothetical protein